MYRISGSCEKTGGGGGGGPKQLGKEEPGWREKGPFHNPIPPSQALPAHRTGRQANLLGGSAPNGQGQSEVLKPNEKKKRANKTRGLQSRWVHSKGPGGVTVAGEPPYQRESSPRWATQRQRKRTAGKGANVDGSPDTGKPRNERTK